MPGSVAVAVPTSPDVAGAGVDASSPPEQAVDDSRTAIVSTTVRRMPTSWHADGAGDQQPTSFSANQRVMPSRLTRSWLIVSRSRMVTASSSSVSKSTVTQNGVPISSWRR